MSIRPLDDDEVAARDAGLDMAARLVGAPGTLTVAQVQALYDVLLEEEAAPEALISLGLAFGSLIVAKSGWEWARISDECGEETCVAVPGMLIHCAPISMVQKRLRRRERLDIAQMRDETIAIIRSRISEGVVKER